MYQKLKDVQKSYPQKHKEMSIIYEIRTNGITGFIIHTNGHALL